MSNETRSGSPTSTARVCECLFLIQYKGIGIGNSNKSSGTLLFGYFFLGAQEKVTCRRSTTDNPIIKKLGVKD
jgi:hypothetical protein